MRRSSEGGLKQEGGNRGDADDLSRQRGCAKSVDDGSIGRQRERAGTADGAGVQGIQRDAHRVAGRANAAALLDYFLDFVTDPDRQRHRQTVELLRSESPKGMA